MEHETEAGLMRESIQTIRKHDKVSQSKFNTFIPQIASLETKREEVSLKLPQLPDFYKL